jgi:hypothetical protein
VLGMSADHGACPLPELVAAGKNRYPAGAVDNDVALLAAAAPPGGGPKRMAPETIKGWAREILKPEFGDGLIQECSDTWLYLNVRVMQERGLKPADVAAALARGLKARPDVLTAYTRRQLSAGPMAKDPLGERVRRSFHAERSGDVAVILRPFHPLSGQYETGTSHGSPFPYDTHVPLVVFGAGVAGKVHDEVVTPQTLAVILAHALGIAPPAEAKTALPKGLFAEPRAESAAVGGR